MSSLAQYFTESGTADSLPADSAFAGGLLETMRGHHGQLPLWSLHRERLQRSGQLNRQTLDSIEVTVRSLVASSPWRDAKLRLRVGERDGRQHWDFTLSPLDPTPELLGGARLFPCSTRLSVGETANPGCKLLQRTGYNRAKEELPTAEGFDGLLRDTQGRVIESLRCNLLLWIGGHWWTPDLRRCGVRGVMRDWLSAKVHLHEADIDLATLCTADEVALCNSVRGVMPVRELFGHRHWAPGPETRRLQQLIAEELW
ncbi:aminotransferase class IV [Microbulbifer hainanensis]|uniref:aminotransferase class IV n=1 Tax=Microbulbifer hainanensis TaxID=2735675 RepID=UPI001868EDCE|nr:aminotransferase class IV [Microbulbifer hainanensis]